MSLLKRAKKYIMRVSRKYINKLLDNTNTLEAVYTLSSFWGPRASKNVNKPNCGLSQVEFDVNLYLYYAAEVGNGGHEQYFFNPSGKKWRETLTALNNIRLTELHNLLVSSLSVFKDSSPPIEWELRNEIIENFDEKVFIFWNQLDRAFYKISNDCENRVLDYLRNNRQTILLEESPLSK